MKLIRPLTITDAILTSSNVPETDYTAYNSGTTYADGDRVRVVSTDVHKVYESLAGSNTGHTPVGGDTDTWWIEVGPTNRWTMFDKSVTSQTTNTDSIDCTFAVTGYVDSVALLNIDAATARIIMTAVDDGVVYDETVHLVSDGDITDWYLYFFEPVERVTDFAVTNLPKYANATIQVILTDTGSDAKCGGLILGQFKDIGQTEVGYKAGIQDYSVKQRDTFGNYTVAERSFNKRADFNVSIESKKIDSLLKLLSSFRATPIVYIGSTNYGSSIVYGFYKDFSIEAGYLDSLSTYTLEVEGLT